MPFEIVRCKVVPRRCTRLARAAAVAVVLASCAILSGAQQPAAPASGDAVDAQGVDPRIAEAITQVSAERIQQTFEKLVSFGNRSTHFAAG